MWRLSLGQTFETFQKSPKASRRKVFFPIKLDGLSEEKPDKRHYPERSRISLGYLSIDRYTSLQLLLILVYKTYTINKNSTDNAGHPLQCQFFISHLNKSNNGKLLDSVGSVPQNWAAI